MAVHERKEKSGITIPETQKQRTTGQKMNIYDYRKLYTRNKYCAKKVQMGDRVYDSAKEAKRAATLEQQEKYGLISGLRKQVPFELQPGYVNNQGKKIRPITYVADFVYRKDGKLVVEDTKGFRTQEYKLKKKMFEYKYPVYTFVES